MKKLSTLLTFVFVFSLLVLPACRKAPASPRLYLPPAGIQSVCMLDGKLLFRLGENLYREDTSDGALKLKPVEGEAGTVGLNVWFCESGNPDAAYMLRQDNNMQLFIDELSKDYERTRVAEVSNEMMDISAPAIVSDGVCYYVKGTPETAGGYGRTLKMFALTDSEERTRLHVWGDNGEGPEDSLSGLRKYDEYLVMTYYKDVSPALWVYDTKKQEMVVSGEEKMAEAAYFQGKLYYIDEANGAIGCYDLEKNEKTDTSIPIQNYVKGMKLACDNDYLYVFPGDSYQENPKASVIQVYNYEGELADRIDLGENADAKKEDMHENPLVCNFFCSTEDYLFIGDPYLTRGLFYVDKEQIGEEGLKIHTLYH